MEEAPPRPDGLRDITARTWALVMTPTRARILRGLGGTGVRPAELVLRTQAPRLRALMTGGPGDSMTALAEDDREFMGQVGLLLDAHRRAGEFDGLVLCAAPEILDRLRRGLPGLVRVRIVAEVPQDLLHLSEAELPGALRRALEKGTAL